MPLASLTLRFIDRELRNRFAGSFTGGLWALIAPLIQLAVYSFVFVHVLSARVPGADAPGSTRGTPLRCGTALRR